MRGWWREAGSWFQRQGEAYWRELSVICREDDVDGQTNVTRDEEWVLRGGWTVMRLCMNVRWLLWWSFTMADYNRCFYVDGWGNTVAVTLVPAPMLVAVSKGMQAVKLCFNKIHQVLTVLFFSHPRSEGWSHHGHTFSIYLCPLSFWLTLPRGVLSTQTPGIVPCIISFSKQLPCFLMVWP